MARARNIKPALFKNELLGVADPLLTILFESLWCLADREGRLEDRPLRIKAETFPYREGLDINGYLTELERLEFIDRYVAEGLAIIQVKNFDKHQNPHKTEKPSELPKKPINTNGCAITVKEPLNDSEVTELAVLIPDSLNTDSLNPISTQASSLDISFNEFWNFYPKKVGKDKALTAWKKKRPNVALVINALEWQKDSKQWLDGFIPNPATYITEGRWKDERPAERTAF
jgi:hypothetical protein